MNILFVTAFAPFGQGEVFSIEEIIAAKKNGHSVTVVPRTFGVITHHKNSESLLKNTLNYKFLDFENATSFLYYFIKSPLIFFEILHWNWKWSWNFKEFLKTLAVMPKAFRVARDLRFSKIDHIHATNTNSMVPMAYIVSRCLKVPWSFTLHSWWPSFAMRRKHFEISIEGASFCRVISHDACNRLKSNIAPILHKKCYPIHIGTACMDVPCSSFPLNRKFIIVTPANVEAHKGPDVAVAAAQLLIDKGFKNFHWSFYGQGSLRNSFNSLLLNTELGDYFSFPGVIANNDLLVKYASGEVNAVVLPSVERMGMPEGIPHALIQAIGYGIPVVSTDSGGTGELLSGGGGISVKQGSATELANALISLISSNEFYENQGISGLLKAKAEFNEKETTDNLLTLFSKFTENNNRR